MSLVKLNVKKGDTVVVLSGKDKGKEGKVIAAMPKKGKVVVEGVNKAKRHTKPNQKAPQGGILVKEMPMHVCKVQLVCPACKKATRVAHKKVNGKSVRACKKCGEVIDQTK
ncbi:50S ribosomal protein L24 [Mitsuokella sp. oral taxon 131]|uniref:50S ribosomal protein L24 n=1 Tax=Mitsuokella sp. oral taxon 131 TaxID=1321780 RepID=UPI0003ADC081|nr:50S ribosomal protein L24 [Mitsuokella sp. oral taxon 131]ERL04505.1 ribosomal protein L24 [Mitsuokella sp. oral taxon 131 str. W9106]